MIHRSPSDAQTTRRYEAALRLSNGAALSDSASNGLLTGLSAALAVARSFAARNHGELLILHVLVPPRVLFEVTYLSPHAYQRLMADLRGGARRQLSALVTGASRKGVRATGRLLEGVPDLLILRVARDARVDMIVMGTHGRRGAARLLLGSVAARVVRLALCPVLTVSA